MFLRTEESGAGLFCLSDSLKPRGRRREVLKGDIESTAPFPREAPECTERHLHVPRRNLGGLAKRQCELLIRRREMTTSELQSSLVEGISSHPGDPLRCLVQLPADQKQIEQAVGNRQTSEGLAAMFGELAEAGDIELLRALQAPSDDLGVPKAVKRRCFTESVFGDASGGQSCAEVIHGTGKVAADEVLITKAEVRHLQAPEVGCPGVDPDGFVAVSQCPSKIAEVPVNGTQAQERRSLPFEVPRLSRQHQGLLQ